MARKHSQNLERCNYFVDLSAFTNTTAVTLARLTADFVELITFRVVHQVAGVGAANITYTMRGGSGGTDVISGSTGALANTSKDTAGTADGNTGPMTPFLAETHFLTLNCAFSGAVTSGPRVVVECLFRR